MTRSYYDARPSKFEAVGNGSYIYRWDIQEEDAPQHQIIAEGNEKPIAETPVSYTHLTLPTNSRV